MNNTKMAVRHFFYCPLFVFPKFFKAPSLGSSLITKQRALIYCRLFSSFTCLNTPMSNVSCLSYTQSFSTSSQNMLEIDAEITMSTKQMASAIQQEASAIDKMVLSLSEQDISKCIRFLEGIEMPPTNIQKLLASHPEILWIEEKTWEVILTFLSTYGLSNDILCQILEKFPTILQLPPRALNSVIESLRQIGIYDQSLQQIIKTYPEIFLLSPSTITKRTKQLGLLFKMDDVLLLIRKSPLILAENWENIEKKFHYVFGTMGITQPQMRHSNLFSYSLEHIQIRHLWVERCGFFKKCKAKEDKKLNPRLDLIIDSSDQNFAKKFGNMTLKEYKTFSKLVQNQISEHSDSEDEE